MKEEYTMFLTGKNGKEYRKSFDPEKEEYLALPLEGEFSRKRNKKKDSEMTH